jgi:hypothetical protein
MMYEWLQHMVNFKFQVHHWRRALLSLIRSNFLACLWGMTFWSLEEYVMLWHNYVVCATIYYSRVENVIKGWCLFVKTWPNVPVAFRRPFSRRTLHVQSNHGWKVHPFYSTSLLDLLLFVHQRWHDDLLKRCSILNYRRVCCGMVGWIVPQHTLYSKIVTSGWRLFVTTWPNFPYVFRRPSSNDSPHAMQNSGPSILSNKRSGSIDVCRQEWKMMPKNRSLSFMKQNDTSFQPLILWPDQSDHHPHSPDP